MATLGANAATYLLYAVAAHALGPVAGGLFLALVAAALLGSMAANIVGVSLTPDIARRSADPDPSELEDLERAMVGWWFAGSCCVMGVLAVFPTVFERVFHSPAIQPILFAAVALVANALLLIGRAVLQGTGRFVAFVYSSAAEAGAKIASAAAVLVWPSLNVALLCFALALACTALVTVAFFSRNMIRRSFQRARLRFTSLHGAPPLAVALTGLTAMTFADGIVARNVLSSADAGFYNAVALAGRALMTILAFIPSVMLAKISRQPSNDHSLARIAFGITGIACIIAVLAFSVFPTLILTVVGGKAYDDGASLVAPYGVAAAALAMASVVATYRIARGSYWIGPVMAGVGGAEIIAMLAYHPSPDGLLHVVIAGHVLALISACAGSGVPGRRRTISPS